MTFDIQIVYNTLVVTCTSTIFTAGASWKVIPSSVLYSIIAANATFIFLTRDAEKRRSSELKWIEYANRSLKKTRGSGEWQSVQIWARKLWSLELDSAAFSNLAHSVICMYWHFSHFRHIINNTVLCYFEISFARWEI